MAYVPAPFVVILYINLHDRRENASLPVHAFILSFTVHLLVFPGFQPVVNFNKFKKRA